MKEKVLITGGTGLIGNRLTEVLFNRGYEVMHLSRTPSNGPVKTFVWDIEKKELDIESIKEADYIIHLAGAGLADKRWTDKRKEVIISSRVDSANLLYQSIEQHPNKIKAFISASGISIYGDRGSELIQESDPPGEGFLSETAVKWEAAAEQFKVLNKRVVIIRTGLVLSAKEGIMPPLKKSLNFGLDPYFGDGTQYYSWIHLDDLCAIYIKAIEDENMSGVYNGVAPEPKTNEQFVREIKDVLNRNAFVISAPRLGLRIFLGEMANVLLMSNNVSSQKLQSEGFIFQYPHLKEAVRSLY